MKKRKTRKYLSMLLVVAMFATLISGGIGNPAKVKAADSTVLYIRETVGGETIIVDTSEDTTGEGWSWNAESKQLLLDGFDGEYIEGNSNLSIVLKGTNKITMEDGLDRDGIKLSGSGAVLTINKTDSDINDKLLIQGGAGVKSGKGINCFCLMMEGGTLDINIQADDTGGMVYGAYLLESLRAKNSAILNVNISGKMVNGITSLQGYGSGKISVSMQAKKSSTAIYNMYLYGKNEVLLSSKTASSTDKAYATEYIGRLSDTTCLTVTEGIVKQTRKWNEFSNVSEKVLVSTINDEKDWVLQSVKECGNGVVYLDAKTGKVIEDGLTFVGQTEVVDFKMQGSSVFDIGEGSVGNTLKNPTSNQNAILLCGGLRGVNISQSNYSFAIKTGTLPEGLTLSSTGQISGEYTKECEAGSVEIEVTRTSDEAKDTFELNYGAVVETEKYLTINGIQYDMSSDANGTKWSYLAATNTLTLNGYEGGTIEAEKNLNIVLQGTNTITIPSGAAGPSIKLPTENADLTINKSSSDINDKLIIQGENLTGNVIGMEATNVVINGGTLELILHGNLSNSMVYGLSSKTGSLKVSNSSNVNLDVEGNRVIVVNKLNGCGSGNINVTTSASKDVVAIDSISLTGSNCVTVSAETNSDSEKAYAIEKIITLCDQTNLTVEKGIVMTDKSSGQMTNEISRKVKITAKSGSKDWIVVPKIGYAFNGMVYVDATTGEVITDGITFVGQSEDVEFSIKDSDLYDIKTGIVGEKLSYEASDYGNIILQGALRGTDFKNDELSYEIIAGSLPKGLSLMATGFILGSYSEECEAGSVEIQITRKSDNATTTVTINYGAVTVGKPIQKVELNKSKVVLDIKDSEKLTATITPADASVQTASWTSSDTTVASVSDGTVVAKSPGKTVVTVTTTQGMYSDSCVVYVKEKIPNAIFSESKIKGLVANADYLVGVDSTTVLKTADANGNLLLNKTWIGKIITIVKVNEETTCNSDAQNLEIPALMGITVSDGKAYLDSAEIVEEFAGTKVTIIANPAPEGKEFDKWEVLSGVISLADARKTTTTFIMPNSEVAVKAVYKDKTPTVTPTPVPVVTPTPVPVVTPTPVPVVTPTPVPTVTPTSVPTVTPTLVPTVIPTSEPENSQLLDAQKIAIGTEYKVKSFTYKVTSVDTKGNGTVSITGSTKSKTKLTLVTIPSSIKIEGGSFAVTAIAEGAFKNYKKIKKVTIGSKVKKIGKSAFNGCKSLKLITIKSKVIKTIDKNAWKGIHKKCKIKVPKTKLKVYKRMFGKVGKVS